MSLLNNEGGYWGYMNDDVRQALANAADSIDRQSPNSKGEYIQLLDDAFWTVAVNSLEVGVGGAGFLGPVTMSTLPTYADNAAAASLANGEVYKTATGELRIKV